MLSISVSSIKIPVEDRQLLWLNENICIDNTSVRWPVMYLIIFILWIIYQMSRDFLTYNCLISKYGMYKALPYAAIVPFIMENYDHKVSDNLGVYCHCIRNYK